MNNLDIWNELKTVPDYAKKTIGGGRLKGMTDISPQWRIMAMTEKFGPCGIGWKYEITETWTETAEGETSAHTKILLFFKSDAVWSDGVPGIGGSMLLAKEKNGPHHSDEAFKMATTDALSVAMKMIGVGADIYMGEAYSKYSKVQNDPDLAQLKKARVFYQDDEKKVAYIFYLIDTPSDKAGIKKVLDAYQVDMTKSVLQHEEELTKELEA